MKITAFLVAAFTVFVAASPTQNAEAVSAAALGASWDDMHSAYCCAQVDCQWYDSGCAVSFQHDPCKKAVLITYNRIARWVLLQRGSSPQIEGLIFGKDSCLGYADEAGFVTWSDGNLIGGD